MYNLVVENELRKRKTDYPRTYFVYHARGGYYLLFWLEHGRDGSLYIWFDDNPNNSWELYAIHNQEKFTGSVDISLKSKSYAVYDPHISWHQSGTIHVSGYDIKGRARQRIISDKKASSLNDLFLGATIPITQMLLPTIDPASSLRLFSKNLLQYQNKNHWIATLDRKGFYALDNSAPREGIFVVDFSIVPAGHSLGFDIWACCRGNNPYFGGKELGTMLYPETFKIDRGSSVTTACLRVFSLPFKDKSERLMHIIATCFNSESIDLFGVKKTN